MSSLLADVVKHLRGAAQVVTARPHQQRSCTKGKSVKCTVAPRSVAEDVAVVSVSPDTYERLIDAAAK